MEKIIKTLAYLYGFFLCASLLVQVLLNGLSWFLIGMFSPNLGLGILFSIQFSLVLPLVIFLPGTLFFYIFLEKEMLLVENFLSREILRVGYGFYLIFGVGFNYFFFRQIFLLNFKGPL